MNSYVNKKITTNEAIKELHRFRYNIICLDHDLGEEKTGYGIF